MYIYTKKNVAIEIDDEDYDKVCKYKWYASKLGKTMYAVSRMEVDGKMKTIYMHRVIMSAVKGEIVDHENLNGLDNKKSNLRKCNQSENLCNRPKNSNNKSGYKGVYFNKHEKKYVAQVWKGGKRVWLGYFKDIKIAYSEYCKYALLYQKDYSNF